MFGFYRNVYMLCGVLARAHGEYDGRRARNGNLGGRKIQTASTQLTIATAVAVVALRAVFGCFMIFVMPKFRIMQKLIDKLNGVSRENLTGIRVIRAYNAEDYQEKKFEAANETITKAQLFTGRMMSMMWPVMILIMNGISLAIYWLGASLINKGETDYATVAAFMQLASQIIMAFMMLMMMFVILPRAQVSAKRINEVLATPLSVCDPEEELPLTEEGTVEFKDVSFEYSDSDEKVIQNISFKANKGETVAFIGSTGSGKSTLVQHLNALIKLPSAQKRYKKPKAKKGRPAPVISSISVGQFDLGSKKCDFKALRASVGMVFQYPEYQLFAESVFSDVAFGLKNFKKGISKEEIEEAVKQSIEIVGLDYEEVKDKSPFDLSGGQKRRVAIAGVIVTKPRILILDEPAAGLDPKGKNEIMELLHKLHREWCKTVIIVSHDMDEVADNCTKACVISEGRVFACDTPNAIFKRADELRALGLDVPLTVKIEKALEDFDVFIDSDCTVGDFSAKVIEVFGGNTGGGEADA